MIELTLPYPPSLNHYKTVGRTIRTKSGKRYQLRVNTPDTNRYISAVAYLCAQQGVKSFDSATISLEVDVYPPDKKKRDLDNILKVLLDSLQKAGLYDDDYQIAKLILTRKEIVKEGKIIVRIALLSPKDCQDSTIASFEHGNVSSADN